MNPILVVHSNNQIRFEEDQFEVVEFSSIYLLISVFKLCFLADLPPLGFRKYFVGELSATENDPLNSLRISAFGKKQSFDFG